MVTSQRTLLIVFFITVLTANRSTQADQPTRSLENIAQPTLELSVPLNARVDGIAESEMAITVAQYGGIGIIHRYTGISDQAEAVKRVKRYRNPIIEQPLTIFGTATIDEATEMMNQHKTSGLLVTSKQHNLIGIVTAQDILVGKKNNHNFVDQIMTPRENIITAPRNMNQETIFERLLHQSRDKLSLTPDIRPATTKDLVAKKNRPIAALDAKDRLLVAAAIGVERDALERAQALLDAEVDLLVIDVANGHADHALYLTKKIKTIWPHIDLMVRNIAAPYRTTEHVIAPTPPPAPLVAKNKENVQISVADAVQQLVSRLRSGLQYYGLPTKPNSVKAKRL